VRKPLFYPEDGGIIFLRRAYKHLYAVAGSSIQPYFMVPSFKNRIHIYKLFTSSLEYVKSEVNDSTVAVQSSFCVRKSRRLSRKHVGRKYYFTSKQLTDINYISLPVSAGVYAKPTNEPCTQQIY
jgi:hypothetical protein